MGNFEYTTIEQQIAKLKAQHLIIENEDFAAWALQTYGYYNIINGYREPYIIRNYDKKTYSPNVTFNQIYALFRLDHIIRDAVMSSMTSLEEHLRALVSDIIGEAFGSEHTAYLATNNYRDRRVNNPKFSRANILATLHDLANTSYKNPIKYYREKHGIVPPWILMKGTDLGTLVNYIRLFKGSQRTKLIQMLYGTYVNEDNMDDFKDLLSDTLSLCLEYRNLAAHGGRIYNYTPSSSIRNIHITNINAGLGILLACLKLFDYDDPYDILNHAINHAVNNYCEDYPNDVPRLESAIGCTITTNAYVWINEKTGIYHFAPHCSGITNAKRVALSSAIDSGALPCKRCCGEMTDSTLPEEH